MLHPTLEVILVLQIILLESLTSSNPNAAQNFSSTDDKRNMQRSLAVNNENTQLNTGYDENVQLNDEDNNEDSDNPNANGNIVVLENQDIPDDYLIDTGKQVKKKRASSFKYADDNKEPGFDLTPDEIQKFKIWKDGVIPYYIDVVSFSDKVLRDKIRNQLQLVNSATGIIFMELPGPPNNDNERWVFFLNRRGLLGCADHTVTNFTNQGVQKVVLGYDCIITRGEVAEAVMSIVGVPAQHNAPDRDKYIKINMENIMPDKKYLFEKLNNNEWLFHDLEYDFNSVTHYGIHKYSVDGRVTIESQINSQDLNPATVFTETDLLKIKMLYNFITKNNKIQTPVCEKLFEFNQLKPIKPVKQLKPRTKPSLYSGIAIPETKTTEDPEVNEEPVENNEDETKDDPKIIETVDYNDNNNDIHHENKNLKEISNDNQQLNDIQKDVLKHRAKKRQKLKLQQKLSDVHSDERIALKAKKKNKVDPLLALSDYVTDEDR